MTDKFWQTPLNELDRQQWEALCDGCGRCCLHKLVDEDTRQLYYTSVACKLYDLEKGCCGDYVNRLRRVSECADFYQQMEQNVEWMPTTCAYRLLWEGKELPDWHYLICGDRERVHEQGVSIKGFAQPYSVIKHDEDLFQYLLEQL